MCWKQEWAAAIGNLEHAIDHIKRAEAKIQGRQLRNERNLKRLAQNGKYNYPKMVAPVEALIQKNRKAEEECRDIALALRRFQHRLEDLIQVHGIMRSENPRRVKQLMGNYAAGKEASA